MILVTVTLAILNQMDFNLVQNQLENCHHDHIPFNVKGSGNIVFSVHQQLIAATRCSIASNPLKLPCIFIQTSEIVKTIAFQT